MNHTAPDEFAELKALVKEVEAERDSAFDAAEEAERKASDLQDQIDGENYEVVEYLVRVDRMICEGRIDEAKMEVREGLLAFNQSPWPFNHDIHHPGQKALL